MADRFDYNDKGNLDDVVVENVKMFRLEYMDRDQIWIQLYRDNEPDVVIWLHTANRKTIQGHHELE